MSTTTGITTSVVVQRARETERERISVRPYWLETYNTIHKHSQGTRERDTHKKREKKRDKQKNKKKYRMTENRMTLQQNDTWQNDFMTDRQTDILSFAHLNQQSEKLHVWITWSHH